jgi:hypothetical protein
MNEPTGIAAVVFNVTDENSVLADQRFIISIRG